MKVLNQAISSYQAIPVCWLKSKIPILKDSWHIVITGQYVIYKPWLLGVFRVYTTRDQGLRKFAVNITRAWSARGILTANFRWPRSRVVYARNTPRNHGSYVIILNAWAEHVITFSNLATKLVQWSIVATRVASSAVWVGRWTMATLNGFEKENQEAPPCKRLQM